MAVILAKQCRGGESGIVGVLKEPFWEKNLDALGGMS